MNIAPIDTLHWLARRLPGVVGGARLERAAMRSAGVGRIHAAHRLMDAAAESYLVDGDLDGWLHLREQRDVLGAVERVITAEAAHERLAA